MCINTIRRKYVNTHSFVLKNRWKRVVFFVRVEKKLYAYKNNLHRDADNFSSRANIAFIATFAYFND